MRQHLARDRDPLVEREKWLLRAAVRNADHELGKESRRTTNQVLVAAGQRIEGSRVNGDDHRFAPALRPANRRPAIIHALAGRSKWNATRPAQPARTISSPCSAASAAASGAAAS